MCSCARVDSKPIRKGVSANTTDRRAMKFFLAGNVILLMCYFPFLNILIQRDPQSRISVS